MKTYETYKESKISWIKQIPENWEVVKLSHYTSVIGGSTPKSNIEEYWGGLINWITTDDLGKVKGKTINKSRRTITRKGLENCSASLIKENSVIISCRAPIGHIAINTIESATNQGCKAIEIVDGFESDYIYYFLLAAKSDLESLGSGSTFMELSANNLKKYRILKPSSQEQTQIAKYLDHKTGLIDNIITHKEELTQKLKEQRQAIINEAVTKSLNPNVKLKDSGIEWLGEIPEHWEVKKIKYIKSSVPNAFVDGPFGSNLKSIHFIDNGEVYVMESGFITSGKFKMKREFKTISKEHFKTIERSSCEEDDIVIAKIGANYGMSGILPKLDKEAVVSGNSLKLTVDKTNNSIKFIHYCLLYLKKSGSFDLIVNESAQPALSLGTLNNVQIAVPKLEEQNIIVEELDNLLNINSKTLNIIEKSIKKLKEYRQSLISEAVTGKIDVRDWQVPNNN